MSATWQCNPCLQLCDLRCCDEPQVAEQLVGQRVQNFFKDFGTFTGEVRSFRGGFLQVVYTYEDGDREDMALGEVRAALAGRTYQNEHLGAWS